MAKSTTPKSYDDPATERDESVEGEPKGAKGADPSKFGKPQAKDAAKVADPSKRPADPDHTDGLPKYKNVADRPIEPRIDPNSSPTSPIFIYDTPEKEDRRLEKPETIRSPTAAEQAVHGAPGITISGKHQDDGDDYVEAGGNPGQIGHGMVLGKSGEADWTAPKHPHAEAPQTKVPESLDDASKLPDDEDDPFEEEPEDEDDEPKPKATKKK
jgi:hypothetical protein